MERRWSGESSPKAPRSLQRKLAESRKPTPDQQNPPDLTDFMNDMFFGTSERKSYNLSGNSRGCGLDDYDDFESSTRSNSSSRSTQEWLEEARRMVATAPSQGRESPGKRMVSPRFAAAAQGRPSVSSMDRRDPLSRSARRHRKVDSFSEEILIKSTAKHTRNLSDTPSLSAVTPPESPVGSPPNTLPPRSSALRRSRFRVPDPPDSSSAAEAPPPLSPPKDATAFRRSASSSLFPAGSSSDDHGGSAGGDVLSPPRRIVESVHRRSVSSSTCSVDRDRVGGGLKMISKDDFADDFSVDSCIKEEKLKDKEKEGGLNAFLKDNRRKAEEVLCGARDARINIVLSGPSNSTTSMVASICYAWLLENRLSKKKGENKGQGPIVVPVMNVKRIRMWKLRQAAWLFNHVGLDATSLFFADEVDLESLMMDGKLSLHVIGQDVLKSNSEVKSQCTILTDNYCEEAYDLLQNSMLKRLLLAGILLDTNNLSTTPKLSTIRDSEAVQLLLVNAAPNYRNNLFDQLTQDHKDNDFAEALELTYGKISDDGKFDSKESGRSSKKSASIRSEANKKEPDVKPQETTHANANKISPNSDKQTVPQKQDKAADSARGKGVFFLARWFGFGPK
ncbi:hypothetical protein MLD38_021890 [Melastoma candidum]|uniref:Uncharacterized protein n=1 Tax=Melastoma candidum TaxID=119954 RepID=A0ACB9QHQ6_9MYRT|nr:hypothetical protein MLD38_021890 [Melastoma candidum]